MSFRSKQGCSVLPRLSLTGVLRMAAALVIGGATAFGGLEEFSHVSADAEAAQDIPLSNFGVCPNLLVSNIGAFSSSAYLRFTVSHPQGVAPTKAVLELWLLAPTGIELQVYRTTCQVEGGGWKEGDGDCGGDIAAPREISWMTKPDDEAGPTPAKTVPAKPEIQFFDVNVTSLLQENLCGGFTICLAVKTTNAVIASIRSKQTAVVNSEPLLRVTYPSRGTGDPCDVPALSEWDLVVLGLMLLIGGTIEFGRRRNKRQGKPDTLVP